MSSIASGDGYQDSCDAHAYRRGASLPDRRMVMTTRSPFLKLKYGAYFHRDVVSEDAQLTHVGPGTPCGEYMRRFWQPVAFSDELKDVPRRIKILGEDLVLFRDLS